MTKPLAVVPANDPLGALLVMADVIQGTRAIFVSPPEVNAVPQKFIPVPDSVEESIAAIVESSGSTGNPKRIAISTKALLHAAHAGQERLGPGGQWLLALPINFIAGQQVLIRSLMAEQQPVIMNTLVPFTAEAFVRSAMLMTHKVKYTSLVPTQLTKLLAAAEADKHTCTTLRGFRAILVGGQSTPDELLSRANSLGLRVVVSYGMTETAGGCVYDGVPLEGVRLKISPDSRLLISGKTLAEGHHDWIYTNDLAELTPEGKLLILGRSDRVIISGGLKVSLDSVEYLGSELQGVQEIAAISLEDQTWGQRVGVAYVGSPEVSDEIVKQLAGLLGPAGKPIRVLRVDKLPKLQTGKTDNNSVAKLFVRQEES